MKPDRLKNLYAFVYENIFKFQRVVKWIFTFVSALSILFLYESGIFERLELLTVDYRFLLRPAKPQASEIAIIEMGEDSIEAIGRWPWPRKWHAALVKILSEYNAKLVAFDVIFSEPQDEIDDGAFEEAIKEARIVYLPMSYNLEAQDVEYLYKGEGIKSVLEPLPRFLKWAKGTGHLNIIPDQDGVLRRVPPVIDYNGKRSRQFSFSIGCDILGLTEEGIMFDPENHFILLAVPRGKDIEVPLDENNQLLINWQGRWGRTFKHFSYIDVIRSYALIKEGKNPLFDLGVFRNKICIVGLTATALMDIKPVPIEKAYPAVGVHAMIIESIVNNDFIRETPVKFDRILIVLISVAMTLLLFRIRPLSGLVLTVLGMASYGFFSVLIFNLFNVLVITIYPLLAIVISFGLTTAYTQALQAIERAYLLKQATLDELTGLYNLRYFNLLLEADFKNISLRKPRHFSLIMSDVDSFKEINDTFGHRAGDEVLKEVAKIMQSKCRQTDVVARYGGEEIVIMLMGTGEEDAVNVAEGIRSSIENYNFKFKDQTCNVTISCGVVEFSNEKTKGELVEKADMALYKAKAVGKNRVCVYRKGGAIETA